MYSDQLAQGATLALVGVATVFVALIITGILVVLIGRLTKKKPVAKVAATIQLPEENIAGGLDRHKIALLAAAASVALKRPVRIRRVRFIAHKHIPTSWAAVGRTEHSINESID